jgi:hypothetical protein
MPLVRSALIATAACLFGAAAYAQPSTTYQSAPPPPMSSDMNSAPSTSQAPDNAPSGPATAQVGTAANTSTTVDANGTQVIASQPVPDTPANRRAFGAPLSHAGKHTAPRGN